MYICAAGSVWLIVNSFSLFVGEQRNIDCYTPGRANDYHGTVNMTSGGQPCLRWDNVIRSGDFPDASITAAENYCRNPVFFDHPWCYVNPPYIEFCPVDRCLGWLDFLFRCWGAGVSINGSSKLACVIPSVFVLYWKYIKTPHMIHRNPKRCVCLYILVYTLILHWALWIM